MLAMSERGCMAVDRDGINSQIEAMKGDFCTPGLDITLNSDGAGKATPRAVNVEG
jgi:hypothetical protein